LEDTIRFLFILEEFGQMMNREIQEANASKEEFPRIPLGNLHTASNSLIFFQELRTWGAELEAFEILLARMSGVPSILADRSKVKKSSLPLMMRRHCVV
jgi:hypothetical protein